MSRDVEAGFGQQKVKERILYTGDLWRAARTTLRGGIQPNGLCRERKTQYVSVFCWWAAVPGLRESRSNEHECHFCEMTAVSGGLAPEVCDEREKWNGKGLVNVQREANERCFMKWKTKLAKNIRASGGCPGVYFNFLIVLTINLFFSWTGVWSYVFTAIKLALVLKGSGIKPMWHSGTGLIFHCGFIFFFHWRISSQDMFQWPNLKRAQERSLCLLCREELAHFRSSSRMNTTNFAVSFALGF